MEKVLVVVDMQNDFVGGVLGTQEARDIVPVVAQKIRDAQAAGIPVVFTKDTHGENYLDTQEGKLLPIPHCIKGTPGHDIVPELMDALADDVDYFYVEKNVFGCEPSLLEDVLMDSDMDFADEYELCGVCTGICVISNAVILRTMYPESKITVDSKAVACLSPEKNAAALETLRSLQVNVI